MWWEIVPEGSYPAIVYAGHGGGPVFTPREGVVRMRATNHARVPLTLTIAVEAVEA